MFLRPPRGEAIRVERAKGGSMSGEDFLRPDVAPEEDERVFEDEEIEDRSDAHAGGPGFEGPEHLGLTPPD
jgi:hypothetical protein